MTMTGKFLFKRIFFAPWALALFPAALLLVFIPQIASKYRLEAEPFTEKAILSFHDIDSDGISETISVFKGDPFYFMAIKTSENLFVDQWNFRDTIDNQISKLYFGDFDNDNNKEIYFFTHSADSLFLNIREYHLLSVSATDRFFITRIGYWNGEISASLFPAGLYDHDNDGYAEFYFNITSYFRLGPRNVYMLDMHRRKLKSGPATSITFLHPQMADVDGDMRPEIFGNVSASGNYPSSAPYSDSSAWFMVYDKDLNFKFNPVAFPGFANGLYISHFEYKGTRGYVVHLSQSGTDKSASAPGIFMFSDNGKLIRYKYLSEISDSKQVHVILHSSPDRFRIFVFSDKIYELNDNLDILNEKDNMYHSEYLLSDYADLNNDGTREYIIYSHDKGKLAVFDRNLEILADKDILLPVVGFDLVPYYQGRDDLRFLLKSNEGGIILSFRENRFYFLGLLSYPGVYLLFVLFIFLVKRTAIHQVEQRENLKQRLLTLQLQGIKSQLDPHFIFNSLNSIASLIYLEEPKTAYDHLNKFTKLLRVLLNDAEKIYRSLNEEIEFLENYLELEMLRFGDRFRYTINLGPGVTGNEQVPKLILHTFAENSVKHAFNTSELAGLLTVKIERRDSFLKIEIEDNGTGRESTSGKSISTGKGLKITKEFYEILNQMNNKKISWSISDLYDDSGKPGGTRVNISVPL